MPSGLQTPQQASSAGNGQSTPHELFALTDEQILEIEPEAQDVGASRHPGPVTREEKAGGQTQASTGPAPNGPEHGTADEKANIDSRTAANRSSTGHGSRETEHDSPEPPPWLAAQMKDPWSGEEARELWNGVQQAKQEAAAYRAAFATPEDARALKELYPGGVNEARAAVERARTLDDIDRAYFGVAGKSPQEVSASRTQLAQMMLREDPAAFREMVFAGLRALEEAEKGSVNTANAANLPRLAQVLAANHGDSGVAPPFSAASSPSSAPTPPVATAVGSGLAVTEHGTRHTSHQSPVTSHQSPVAAYAAFEKAANEDLECSVGAAITRTIEQALPNLNSGREEANAGARSTVPLRDRLSAAVRHDVEAALKGDRQLGEQIAQILSTRRFDNETRAQVVRLIDDRARQLVPVAAKRVINDWTQSTLAAHRTSAARSDAASARRELEPAVAHGNVAQGESASPTALSSRRDATTRGTAPRAAARSSRVDYRKLSDEQILDL
jgi:hypothetical protein